MGFVMVRSGEQKIWRRLQKAARITGLLIAAPIVLWFVLGFLGFLPSVVQVFGSAGVRTPATIVVAGLLIAALGFWDE
jgi:hypothetical protein